MLIKHGPDLYSWGDSKSFSGLRAKANALLDGCKKLGINEFRKSAAKSISQYEIEMTIAEFRAKGDRDMGHGPGTTDDSMTEEVEDINQCEGSLSQKNRDKIPAKKFAGPHRSFPINSQEEVDAAAKLLGHAKPSEQAEIKRNIIRLAKEQNFSLPETWK